MKTRITELLGIEHPIIPPPITTACACVFIILLFHTILIFHEFLLHGNHQIQVHKQMLELVKNILI